ncbi:MAG: HmuY family protein, partial [Myxococcaceae bacterium]
EGVTRTTVDSSHKEAWVYFDFDRREEIAAVDAAGDRRLLWELAFQRFKIISNGGVSGAGVVVVAQLSGVSLAEVIQPPSEGFAGDAPDGPDDNSDVDSTFLAGDGWYSYHLLQHKVLARENTVYVVRTSADAFFAMQILSYYDAAGSAGHLSFAWKWLNPP